MFSAHIRLARVADRAAVEACVSAAYEKYLSRMDTPPAPLLADYGALIERRVVYVLTEPTSEEIGGVIVCWPEENALFVENVAVHPSHQGRGFGHRLMVFAEQLAQSAGLPEVRLYTNEAMTENLAFYASLGFEETARGLDHGYRRVYLRKRVGSCTS